MHVESFQDYSRFMNSELFLNSGFSTLINVLNNWVCYPLLLVHLGIANVKETKSVTMNIFRKKYFLFKSLLKIELSYVFTIDMFSTAENCIEK